LDFSRDAAGLRENSHNALEAVPIGSVEAEGVRVVGVKWGAWPVLALVLLLLAGFLSLLAANSIRYSVAVDRGRLVITALGHRIEGPAVSAWSPLRVTLAPQERYSTGQLLVSDHGALVNGLRFVRFLLTRRPDPMTEFALPAGAGASYVHFNPFRAAVLVREEGREICRLEVNVPDAKIELWQEGSKAQDVPLQLPWLRLTLVPLAASVLAAALLAVLMGFARPGTSPAATALTSRDWLGGNARMRAGLTSAAVFVIGAVVVGFVHVRVFRTVPGFGDEINYLMQAKIFAARRLFVPEPAMPEFFKVGWTDLWWTDGKLWGFHPPGSSVLLAIGWLVGLPWLTVPLVAGAILGVQHRLALGLLRSEAFALLHVGILGTSHYFLSLASSYMAHAPSLLFISLFFLSLLRFVRHKSKHSLVFAALWIGIAFVIRPVSAVLAGAVPLVALAASLRRRLLPKYAAALVVGLAVSSTIFLYTWSTTGQFAVPYSVKGPEAGQTLLVRLAKPMHYHLANLYRNCNELQHRFHGFGLLGNVLFFFVPLVTWTRQRDRSWLAIAYVSFAFFVVAHSFLHWYGWKWEPRMLYDVSFLFFLVTTAGVQTLVGGDVPSRWARTVVGGLVVAGVAYAAAIDLPHRFATEYWKYNSAPSGVMEKIQKQGIRDAVIFFGSELAYASYLPFNTVTFDGDIVFAKSVEENYDYRLLTRFPSKSAYFSPDGMTLEPRHNFYRRDAATLARQLPRVSGRDAVVVMPWLGVAPTSLNNRIPATLMEPGHFLESLAAMSPQADPQRLVAFLGSSTELAALIDLFSVTGTRALGGFEGPITFRTIGPLRGPNSQRFPGLWMTCYAGTNWSGEAITRQLIAALDLGPCLGESRSIVWDARFELRGKRSCHFVLESDDGSGLFIDGRLLIDNGLDNTHGPETKSADVTLDPGVHTMQVKYFNGPDGEFLRLTLNDRHGDPRPISVAGFIDEFYFFVDTPGARPQEVRR